MRLNEQPAQIPPPPPPGCIALISEHASPLAAPGSVDCGGQNV
jgi:D-inositol-3-phosphate glycosyltransferase